MALEAAVKAQIVKDYQQSESDTGSPEVQVALLTANIEQLQSHFKDCLLYTSPSPRDRG